MSSIPILDTIYIQISSIKRIYIQQLLPFDIVVFIFSGRVHHSPAGLKLPSKDSQEIMHACNPAPCLEFYLINISLAVSHYRAFSWTEMTEVYKFKALGHF